MYRTFSIKNFRCFDELTVEGLGRINLIAGKNNMGKTALLEALWVHSGGPSRPERSLRLETLRGLGPINPINAVNHLFYSFNNSIEIGLSACGDWDGYARELSICAEELDRVQVPLDISDDEVTDPNRPVPQKQLMVHYLDESGRKSSSKSWLVERKDNPGQWNVASRGELHTLFRWSNSLYLLSRGRVGRAEDASRYSELEVLGRQDKVLEVLQQIEPALKRLAVVSSDKLPTIYADVGVSPLIPIQLLGDGMSRILSLALAIASSSGGMVMVDEIENGIHHSVMEKVWKAVGAFARSYDVQLFATTHSYECIGAAYRAFELDEEDELRLYRIDRSRSHLRAVRYDRERIGRILESGMEVI